ncbi:MAG TPA: biopolymer transporter ExbD [Sphingobacterium sp.]|nr:biopolymer transporter ExbD [Sphingobacterium sp.]
MAELKKDSGDGKKDKGGRVDLTAMVDLAFLLITFFMLTTSLNKPQAMDVAMPDKNKIEEEKDDKVEIADNRSVTLLLGSDNKILWYYGQLANPIYPPEVVDYSKSGLREVLQKMKKEVPARSNGKDLIVVIRPSEKSIHRNLVDVLDEMKIVDVKRYMIAKIGEADIEQLKEENLFND